MGKVVPAQKQVAVVWKSWTATGQWLIALVLVSFLCYGSGSLQGNA